MKRKIAAILAAILLLSVLTACGSTPPAEETPSPTPTATPTPTPTPITDPLTGEVIDEDISELRPYAIMINNLNVALPQVGVSGAGIIYEILAEGGITRMMAVFSDLSDSDVIGSMRSLRPYYLSVALSYDAIMVHAGGSEQAYSDVKTLGVDNIDGVRGTYAQGTYFRDPSRRSYGDEHSLFAKAEGILATAEEKGFRTEHDSDYDNSYGIVFSENAAEQCTEKAGYVRIVYHSGKNTSFVYDEAASLYEAYQYGSNYTDNGQTDMTFSNVLILVAPTRTVDSYGRLAVDLVGSGTGYYCCGGKYVPVNWERGSTEESFVYTLEDGSPLEWAPGRTFIGIIAQESDGFGSGTVFKEEYTG